MTLKQDIEDTKKEIKNIQDNNHSIAWELLKDLKKTNIRLFIANIVLVIALIISIVL